MTHPVQDVQDNIMSLKSQQDCRCLTGSSKQYVAILRVYDCIVQSHLLPFKSGKADAIAFYSFSFFLPSFQSQ